MRDLLSMEIEQFRDECQDEFKKDVSIVDPSTLEEKLLELVTSIDWKNSRACSQNGPYPVSDDSVNRLKEISNYLVNNIRKRAGTEDWRSNFSYLNGILAAVSFSSLVNTTSVFISNAVFIASAVLYKGIGLYTESIKTQTNYYGLRYKKMRDTIMKAFDNGLFTLVVNNSDEQIPILRRLTLPDSFTQINIQSNPELLNMIESMVVALHNTEKALSIKLESLSTAKLSDCCIHMLEAAVNRLSLTSDIEKGYGGKQLSSTDVSTLTKSLTKTFIDNIAAFYYEIIPSSYAHINSRAFLPSAHEFENILRLCYRGKEAVAPFDLKSITDAALTYKPIPANDTVVIGNDNVSPDVVLKLLSKTILDDRAAYRHYSIINTAILFSSIGYSLGFYSLLRNSSEIEACGEAIISFGFAQISDKLLEKCLDRYKNYQKSHVTFQEALRLGFDRSSNFHSKSNWFEVTENGIKASDRLQQIQYTVAKTWNKLCTTNNLKLEDFNSQDMITTSMNMYVAMGKAYDKTGSLAFRADMAQLDKISYNWAKIIGPELKSHNSCSFSSLYNPFDRISLGDIPASTQFYNVVDKVINLFAIKSKTDEMHYKWKRVFKALVSSSHNVHLSRNITDEQKTSEFSAPFIGSINGDSYSMDYSDALQGPDIVYNAGVTIVPFNSMKLHQNVRESIESSINDSSPRVSVMGLSKAFSK
jgi:hypothetical protein